MSRETVTSVDDTPIAYWPSGVGPPLVLVHGTAADHIRWTPVLPVFEQHFTVCAVDRRGRGGSGDSGDYAIEREFEDIAAVVDSLGSQRSYWATPTGRCARSRLLCSPGTSASWCSTSRRWT